MYQFLQNPKNLARVFDALFVLQIALYLPILIIRYHVRDLDPLIMTGWADLLQTLCFIFVAFGALEVFLFLMLLESMDKRALFSIHRIILATIVIALVSSGTMVVSWINANADTYSGGWPFVQL